MSWLNNNTNTMDNQNMLRIKCILGDDIRIIKINYNISYENLLLQLEEDFQQPVVVYQYEDYEGDKVTVRSKSDLMESLSMCQELKSINPNKIITLKFFLKFQYNSSSSPTTTSSTSTATLNNSNQNVSNNISNSSSNSFYNSNNSNGNSNGGITPNGSSGSLPIPERPPRKGSNAPPLRTPPPSPPKSITSNNSNSNSNNNHNGSLGNNNNSNSFLINNNNYSPNNNHFMQDILMSGGGSSSSLMSLGGGFRDTTPPLRTPPGSPKFTSPLIQHVNSPPPLRTPPPSPPPSSPVSNTNANFFTNFDKEMDLNDEQQQHHSNHSKGSSNSKRNSVRFYEEVQVFQQQSQPQQQPITFRKGSEGPRPSSPLINHANNNPNNNNPNNNNKVNSPPPLQQQQQEQGFTDFPTLILNEHEELKTNQPIKWQKGQILGRGGYGAVYLGLNTDNGELFAVKQLEIMEGSMDSKFKNMLLSFSKEIEVMKTLKHENIVRYLGTCFDQTHLNVFLEYIPGGSISSLLNRFGAFSENVIKVYTKQILHGLAYLHSNQIIHRDIKGANILIDTKGIVKLSDFGCSKSFSGIVSQFKSMQGTPYWMAPEIIKQTGHGRSSDIWSLGCVIIEMATAQPPWSNITEMAAVMYHIASSTNTPKLPDHLSPDAIDFLNLCLRRDPKERPDANQLLKHPFISNSQDIIPSSKELSILIPSAPRYRFSSNPTPIKIPTLTIATIPRALLIHIFKYLNAKTLLSKISSVCKSWHAIIFDDDHVWRIHCLERGIIRNKEPSLTWRSTVTSVIKHEKQWFESKISTTTLKGHSKCVYCIKTFEHQQTSYILSGGEDKKVKIWDCKKNKHLFSLKGHSGCVKSVDVQQDFQRIFTASSDFTSRVWSTKTKKTMKTYSNHKEAVTSINYLGDLESKVLTSSLDKSLMIWDVETGNTISNMTGHSGGVYSVRFDQSRGYNHTVVSCSSDWTSRVWDTRTSKTVRTFKGHSDDVTCVYVYDSKVATGSGDGTINLWDIGTGKIINTYIPHETQEKQWVWCVQFDLSKLISSGKGGVIRVWDLNQERSCRTFGGHNETIFALSYRESKLVTASKDKLIKIWDLDNSNSNSQLSNSTSELHHGDIKLNNSSHIHHNHSHTNIISRTSSFIKNI
ncbi:protein serine/threonine kinase [Tieghemostelium lacteum]|uniref:Protein serine/threonine kinase n=1 Tax=Tieghemostelium lacteum TaxID=361077 RepID=A0A151ZHI9_TIELA|nr:protein serine/threonine kinase [Tieghemostelium lacteum]|eukprot:KYQ93387.1 protein serine/threonine kinase [Tieghemostelium lacteum]